MFVFVGIILLLLSLVTVIVETLINLENEEKK